MMIFLAIFTVLCLSTHGKKVKPDWDNLSVTFPKFSTLPKTEQEALDGNWKLTADGCKDKLHFKGRRYVLNGEMATMLLFDKNGNSAGLQMAIDIDKSKTTKNGRFAVEGKKYVVTAYFTRPSKICRGGCRVNDGYVGDKLYLVLNNGPVEIPLNEKCIGATKWTKGKCFPKMGQHYWYDVSKDMDCNNAAPFFLMYNGGKLNGFGFAVFGDLQSSRVEHPTPQLFDFFFAATPDCFAKEPHITTQHVYLRKRPDLITC